MTPREELEELFRRLLAPAIASRDDMSAVIMADAVLAAGYRKVEAGRDARETAQTLVSEILKEHRHDDPRELNPTCGSCENKVATAITAAVEAQRERDARIVAAAIEMAEACKRAVPSESAADAEVTRYENARHRLQTVCAAAIREG